MFFTLRTLGWQKVVTELRRTLDLVCSRNWWLNQVHGVFEDERT